MNNEFGFNINLKNSPDEIRALGEKYLSSGLFSAIEVTYYENLEEIDTFEYNKAIKEICDLYHPVVFVHIIEVMPSEQNTVIRSAILSEIENCLRYTRWLGGEHMVIHAGRQYGNLHAPIVRPDGSRGTSEDSYKVTFALSVDMMKKACFLGKKYGVALYTENLAAPSFTQTSRILLDYIEAVGFDNLKIVFDVGHCHHTGHDVVSEVREASPLLAHLHIHDNDGVKDLHQSLGEGNLDVKEFVQVLEEVNYSGLLMFELYRCTVDNLARNRQLLIDNMKEKPAR
ncbi:MAG: sugar phosphate isomerase/epimerase family protein [Sphaerochaetaceae bacterium]|nr:sugar phosphate isomerase/epimerase family protein [Sphaerochaetaceae bacterium]